ncbi:helix-turn-helix domain-containing protein [Pseudomonas matsuisoli]|uniref:Transcriptional regulator n=1 Tax=Pseudomonas matsuisoli TaxID=1515666 RepID=A0A917UYY1_9PSED|nr:helix-turn-helix transcriptional regulator [Pseudomonas matsuisoli]GGJ98630.1 transcriptional regulator [Pseudomonas matsuisoli]
MKQAVQLVDALKKQLKAHGKTYADVARHVGLSEASIKRIFAENTLTLDRLEQICTLIDLDFVQLIHGMQSQDRQTRGLTEAQEQEIADDHLLLLVAVCVVNGYGLADILAQYQLSEAECLRKLVRLERLNLIELMPGNRIKLRIAPNFRWLPAGPIQRFFQAHVASDFFRSRFDREGEQLVVLNGLLSPTGNAQWQRKMQRLVTEFNDLCREEADLPLAERFGTTAVLAVRQWQSSVFKEFGR